MHYGFYSVLNTLIKVIQTANTCCPWLIEGKIWDEKSRSMPQRRVPSWTMWLTHNRLELSLLFFSFLCIQNSNWDRLGRVERVPMMIFTGRTDAPRKTRMKTSNKRPRGQPSGSRSPPSNGENGSNYTRCTEIIKAWVPAYQNRS